MGVGMSGRLPSSSSASRSGRRGPFSSQHIGFAHSSALCPGLWHPASSVPLSPGLGSAGALPLLLPFCTLSCPARPLTGWWSCGPWTSLAAVPSVSYGSDAGTDILGVMAWLGSCQQELVLTSDPRCHRGVDMGPVVQHRNRSRVSAAWLPAELC